ncbi:MAG: 2,3-bisphosphoglycerate-independent phosphoglycerate mutase [Elusimicrobiota bacterium]
MIGKKIKEIIQQNSTKIVLVVMDGVGDIPETNSNTALESACTPNMDALASKSELGLSIPVDRGITPGSGPAHVSLFGYDPLEHEIGRGVLEALGIGIELKPDDLAARANFATRTEEGIITDRRAGRISTEKNEELCARINEKIKSIKDVGVKVYPGKEHRFVVIFNGKDLHDNLRDADPQQTEKKEKLVEAGDKKSQRAASIANEFIKKLNDVLKDSHPANTCLLRGMAKLPKIEKFDELYGMKSCAIATYPMYKGLSRLVGMEVKEGLKNLEDEISALERYYEQYDFFYLHVKKTDSYGEDGNLKEKIKVIEKFDKLLSKIEALNPDVLCITADHSTPAIMKSHSWHPCPFLLKSPYCRYIKSKGFNETACLTGTLGTFMAKDAMQLMLAHASRLNKFGA